VELKMQKAKLNMTTYLDAFKSSPSRQGIKGGTIWDFIRESKVTRHKNAWLIEHWRDNDKCVIGGVISSKKPELRPGAELDFLGLPDQTAIMITWYDKKGHELKKSFADFDASQIPMEQQIKMAGTILELLTQADHLAQIDLHDSNDSSQRHYETQNF